MPSYSRYCADLDAAAHNFRQVKSMLADAYGPEDVPVARVLVAESANMIAVVEAAPG